MNIINRMVLSGKAGYKYMRNSINYRVFRSSLLENGYIPFEFSGEEDLLFWGLDTDHSRGGNSTAYISIANKARKDY